MNEERKNKLKPLLKQVGEVAIESIQAMFETQQFDGLRHQFRDECGFEIIGLKIEMVMEDQNNAIANVTPIIKELISDSEFASRQKPASVDLAISAKDREFASELKVRMGPEDIAEIEGALRDKTEPIAALPTAASPTEPVEEQDARSVTEITNSIMDLASKIEPAARIVLVALFNSTSVTSSLGVGFTEADMADQVRWLQKIEEIISKASQKIEDTENLKEYLASFEKAIKIYLDLL